MRATLAAAALLAAVPAAAPADTRPFTVPAVRGWHATGGTERLAAHPRVVALAGASRAEARKLAHDLGGSTTARARPGDVVLAHRGGLGAEAYVLRIGRTFRIEASAPAGWFYGGRTLLQLGGRQVPRGVARDAPAFRERGLMIDVGRRFYPRAWLAARIRELAGLKLNLLHLHLSDDQGFRIESTTHPEIVSADHLSKADVRALLKVARRNHVTIVPEIDMPGHMTAALAKHPDLQLKDIAGQPQPDKLDVTLPAARRFVAQIVGEELKLFSGPYWHAGADEYLGAFSTAADFDRYPQLAAFAQKKFGPDANGHDAVQDFVNTVGAQIRAAGKRMRVWSDGIPGGSKVSLMPGAVVEWWENRVSQTPAEIAAAGHDVLNVGWWPLYYVNGSPLSGLRSTEADFYEQWQPWRFEGPYTTRWAGDATVSPPDAELPRTDHHLLGATLAVWNDGPTDPAGAPGTLPSGIGPRLRILAQKTWGSKPLTASYADFAAH
ncbi:MAG: hexosaminidase [Solirubrobacteraceae bacterium]|nr:hexosaminidase [Solirubrobacteraceae bacterium]